MGCGADASILNRKHVNSLNSVRKDLCTVNSALIMGCEAGLYRLAYSVQSDPLQRAEFAEEKTYVSMQVDWLDDRFFAV
jgi:hypothetical protein